tara:strand:+ start:441 stop:563 length:123 start_codon:yes stop_codon:yes gene_type:complete
MVRYSLLTGEAVQAHQDVPEVVAEIALRVTVAQGREVDQP